MNIRKAFIVAEIGLNHMGDAAYADQYIESLGTSRPDGLTFQVREPAFYAKQAPGTSPLSDRHYRHAAERTKELGMRFGVALCDVQKTGFFESIGTDFYKVLSKDIGNRELVAAVLSTGKPVYVSTGMSSENEVGTFLSECGEPANLSLIHTQLSYADADANLRAIGRLRDEFGYPVAFGLHSPNTNALFAALGFSPSALFFYVKGRRKIQHRDEDHAVGLSWCHVLIEEIRKIEVMMGSGVKRGMQNSIPDQGGK